MQRTFYLKSERDYNVWKEKAEKRGMSVSAYLQWLVDNDKKVGLINLIKRQEE